MKSKLLHVEEGTSGLKTVRSQVFRGCVGLTTLSLVLLGSVLFLGRLVGNNVTSDVASSARLVQTSSITGDRLAQKPNVPFGDDFPFQGPVIDVGDIVDGHELAGFGGAFTEAVAVVYNQMPEDIQKKFIELHFGAGGLDYSLGRVPINSCDFSLSSYSFDDVPDDFDLKHFDTSLKRDSDTIIALINTAQKRLKERGKSLKLYGSPWSPPAWMKGNGAMETSSDPCLKANPKYHQAWADYIAKWIDAYQQHGVPIWGITIQNEPEFNASWEACKYTAEAEADFLGSYLGPTLKGKYPDLQIFAYDHNKDHVYEWAQTFHAHPTASKYVDGVAVHWYSGDLFENVEKVTKDFPEFKILPSEATAALNPSKSLADGDWVSGLGYAHDIMGDLNSGAIGWTDWNMVLDDQGGPNHLNNWCDAPLRYNRSSKELFIHPQYWFLAHFSKYIPPGSRRMSTNVTGSTSFHGQRPAGTCTEADGVQATAFKQPNGSIAVVALNCGPKDISFKLRYAGKAAAGSLPAYGAQTYSF